MSFHSCLSWPPCMILAKYDVKAYFHLVDKRVRYLSKIHIKNKLSLCIYLSSVLKRSWATLSPVSHGNLLWPLCVFSRLDVHISNSCVLNHDITNSWASPFALCLQLLKALFGTNLASQYEGASSHPCRSQGKALRLGSTSVRPGLYHYCFMAPYTHFTQALADASLRNMVQAEQEQDASG